jgi:hypothetical protein
MNAMSSGVVAAIEASRRIPRSRGVETGLHWANPKQSSMSKTYWHQPKHRVQLGQSQMISMPSWKVVGPKSWSLKCSAIHCLSSLILSLDLDARVMSSTKTGRMTLTPSCSQMKIEASECNCLSPMLRSVSLSRSMCRVN